MYRKTYAEIDLEKLENNIKKIKEVYTGYEYYFGVVKNNAYAHGIECIKTMIKAGVNYLAVATVEEGIEVRKIDKKIPVLVLEPVDVDSCMAALENNLTITIDNLDVYKALKKNKAKGKFHMAIDAGMNRFGFKNKKDINTIYNDRNDDLYLEGIFTHLSTGNINNPEYLKEKKQFEDLTSDINLSTIDIVHLDRSLTMEQHDKLPYANGVRLGIIMYGFANRGYYPSKLRRMVNALKGKKTTIIEPKIKLETVFTFKSTVMEVKKVKAGENVGYAGMYIADENKTIAIIPYGFADYLYNNMSNVCINGKLYKTLVINMDVTIVEVDNSVKVGDSVEIFGDKISLRQKAIDTEQNVYKVLASVSTRVPRVYKYKEETKEIKY